jgi:hypothetical protein
MFLKTLNGFQLFALTEYMLWIHYDTKTTLFNSIQFYIYLCADLAKRPITK